MGTRTAIRIRSTQLTSRSELKGPFSGQTSLGTRRVPGGARRIIFQRPKLKAIVVCERREEDEVATPALPRRSPYRRARPRAAPLMKAPLMALAVPIGSYAARSGDTVQTSPLNFTAP